MSQISASQRALQENNIYTFKTIYFHLGISNKRMLVFFRTRMRKILIWQKSFTT